MNWQVTSFLGSGAFGAACTGGGGVVVVLGVEATASGFAGGGGVVVGWALAAASGFTGGGVVVGGAAGVDAPDFLGSWPFPPAPSQADDHTANTNMRIRRPRIFDSIE